MPKPTYYLWKTKEITMEDIEKQKQYWIDLGFRVVILVDGSKEGDINEGLKEILINHMNL